MWLREFLKFGTGELGLLVLVLASIFALARTLVVDAEHTAQKDDLTVAIEVALAMGFLGIGAGLLSSRIARRRGRNPLKWFLLGFALLPCAILALYYLPALPRERERPPGPAPDEEPPGPSAPDPEPVPPPSAPRPRTDRRTTS